MYLYGFEFLQPNFTTAQETLLKDCAELKSKFHKDIKAEQIQKLYKHYGCSPLFLNQKGHQFKNLSEFFLKNQSLESRMDFYSRTVYQKLSEESSFLRVIGWLLSFFDFDITSNLTKAPSGISCATRVAYSMRSGSAGIYKNASLFNSSLLRSIRPNTCLK